MGEFYPFCFGFSEYMLTLQSSLICYVSGMLALGILWHALVVAHAETATAAEELHPQHCIAERLSLFP